MTEGVWLVVPYLFPRYLHYYDLGLRVLMVVVMMVLMVVVMVEVDIVDWIVKQVKGFVVIVESNEK